MKFYARFVVQPLLLLPHEYCYCNCNSNSKSKNRVGKWRAGQWSGVERSGLDWSGVASYTWVLIIWPVLAWPQPTCTSSQLLISRHPPSTDYPPIDRCFCAYGFPFLHLSPYTIVVDRLLIHKSQNVQFSTVFNNPERGQTT